MTRTRSSLRLLLACLPCLACGGSDEATGPDAATTGTLVIIIATSGEQIDADGYVVSAQPSGFVDRSTASDTLRIPNVAPATYEVTLSAIAANCTAVDGVSRTATVAANEETVVAFEVECSATSWEAQSIASQAGIRIGFAGPTTGFAHGRGDSRFFMTTDGGATWSERGPHGIPGDIGSLFHVQSTDLVFVGGASLRLGRTMDQGQSWQTQRLGTTGNYLLSMHFVDERNGWLGGDGGWLLRTRDGGETWQVLGSPTSVPIFGLFFADTANGVLTAAGGKAFTTNNGGANWTQRASGTQRHLQGMSFANDSVGVAVGDDGVIVRTTDRGVTWSIVASGTSTQLWGVDFGSDGFGVAVGDEGTILITRDAGQHWVRDLTTATGTLSSAAVVDSMHAWIGGGNGVLLTRKR